MSFGASLQGARPAIIWLPSVRIHHSQENSESPMANLESFDVIYYAALQVVIVSSANGVSICVCSSLLVIADLHCSGLA